MNEIKHALFLYKGMLLTLEEIRNIKESEE